MSSTHLKYVDGLKGFAFLIVLFSHYVVAFYPAIYSGSAPETHNQIELFLYNSPLKVIVNGEFGVCVFLILTGFLVGRKFLKNYRAARLIKYPIHRYIRLIFPILFGNLIAYFILKYKLNFNHEASMLTYSSWWLGSAWRFPPNLLNSLSDALFLVFLKKQSYENIFNPALWPIPIFYFGSLLVAALGYVIRNKSRLFKFIIYLPIFYIGLQTLFYPLIIGLIFSDLSLSNKNNIPKINRKTTILLIMICIYLGSFPNIYTTSSLNQSIFKFLPTQLPIIHNISFFYHTVAASILIAIVLFTSKLRQLFSQKWIVFFGSISYSFFIFSVISIYSLSSFIFVSLISNLGYNVAVLISIIVNSLFLTVFSSLFTKHVEKPLSLSTAKFVNKYSPTTESDF